MDFEQINITMNSDCTSTSGIAIPVGTFFNIPLTAQAFSEANLKYYAFIDAFYNEACFDAEKTAFRIQGLNEVVIDPELGVNVVDQVESIIDVSSEADVDTNEKRKALIIIWLADKLGKEVADFS